MHHIWYGRLYRVNADWSGPSLQITDEYSVCFWTYGCRSCTVGKGPGAGTPSLYWWAPLSSLYSNGSWSWSHDEETPTCGETHTHTHSDWTTDECVTNRTTFSSCQSTLTWRTQIMCLQSQSSPGVRERS